MAIQLENYPICDNCGKSPKKDHWRQHCVYTEKKFRWLRSHMADDGWLYIGGKDFCPKCAKGREGKPASERVDWDREFGRARKSHGARFYSAEATYKGLKAEMSRDMSWKITTPQGAILAKSREREYYDDAFNTASARLIWIGDRHAKKNTAQAGGKEADNG